MNFSSETPCGRRQPAFLSDFPYHSSRFSGIQLKFHPSSPRNPLSPRLRSLQRRPQAPHAKSKLLAIIGSPGLLYKQSLLEKVLATIAERLRVAKISPDEGMDARAVLERETLIYEDKKKCRPTWACLDWLGSMADLQPGSKGGTSERAMMWEYSANSCVKFADSTGIPTVVLAQAVNDAQMRRMLTLGDIGISKGIGKNMVTVVGITNSIDQPGVKAAVAGSRQALPSPKNGGLPLAR
jgi:hypothetical protein